MSCHRWRLAEDKKAYIATRRWECKRCGAIWYSHLKPDPNQLIPMTIVDRPLNCEQVLVHKVHEE